MVSISDELELDDETPSERLARELAESDINLIHALRRARERQGLSQKDLGELLGVSQATVSDFESGASEPKLSTVRRYAHALGVLVVHDVRPLDGSLPEVVSVPTAPAAGSTSTDFAIGA